jgi:hypothetical protein
MLKLTKTILLMFLVLGASFSFGASSSLPINGENARTKIEIRNAKRAEKAQLKMQRKAERKARYVAWLGGLATKGSTNAIALILCFFLGWLGIHRVFMGGSALLILGYLFTAGGIFGLLPLIDFIRLIIDSDHYKDNSRFFRAFE